MFCWLHATELPARCRYSTTACSCSSKNCLFTMVVVVTACEPVSANALSHSVVTSTGT